MSLRLGACRAGVSHSVPKTVRVKFLYPSSIIYDPTGVVSRLGWFFWDPRLAGLAREEAEREVDKEAAK